MLRVEKMSRTEAFVLGISRVVDFSRSIGGATISDKPFVADRAALVYDHQKIGGDFQVAKKGLAVGEEE